MIPLALIAARENGKLCSTDVDISERTADTTKTPKPDVLCILGIVQDMMNELAYLRSWLASRLGRRVRTKRWPQGKPLKREEHLQCILNAIAFYHASP